MSNKRQQWVWWVDKLGTDNPRLVKCVIVRMGPKRVTLAGDGFYGQRTFARRGNKLLGLNGSAIRFNAIDAITNALGNLEYQLMIARGDINRIKRASHKLRRSPFLGTLVRYAKVIR